MKKNNNKGFTLAELLIVVAIIAVLVAISIPIFTSQLEKARESTDAANIRAAYAEVVATALTDDEKTHDATVTMTQTQDDWQNASISGQIANGEVTATTNVDAITTTYSGTVAAHGTAKITYTPASGTTSATVVISFN